MFVIDLCLLECASVLRKQVLRGTMTSEESMPLLADLLLLPLRSVAATELVVDATYLALAVRHGAQLMTADGDLATAAANCGCHTAR